MTRMAVLGWPGETMTIEALREATMTPDDEPTPCLPPLDEREVWPPEEDPVSPPAENNIHQEHI